MYTYENYKTKKALREAVTAGKQVRIFQPGGIFNPPEAAAGYTGVAYVEGPHYPAPHSWYAEVQLISGVIVKVK